MTTFKPIFHSPISNPPPSITPLQSPSPTLSVYLADLSGVQVTLIQGEVDDLLQRHFPALPTRPGDVVDVSGGVLARLTARELYLFGLSPAAPLPAVATLNEIFTRNQRFAHASDYTHGKTVLRLTGIPVGKLLSKICGLDFYDTIFPSMRIAQTSAAKIKTLIVRRDENGKPVYFLQVSRPLGQYFWEVVWDVGQEFGITID